MQIFGDLACAWPDNGSATLVKSRDYVMSNQPTECLSSICCCACTLDSCNNYPPGMGVKVRLANSIF